MIPEAVLTRVFGCDPNDVNDTTSPDTLAEWDSLGHITLLIELESTYGVSFSPEETLAMNSVAAVKRALQAHDVQW
jgi:acyl carrier protein